MFSSSRLGLLTVECDCPPYAIVAAAQRVGIREPEDVRWSRLSHHLNEPPSWRELLSLHGLRTALGFARRRDCRNCVCGQPMPCLAQYAFTYNTGTEESYLLGQCGRCRTVFWEEP
jgi:hypothetical protein